MFFYNMFNRFKRYGHTKCRWDFIIQEQREEKTLLMLDNIKKMYRKAYQESALKFEIVRSATTQQTKKRKKKAKIKIISNPLSPRHETYDKYVKISSSNKKAIKDPDCIICGCDEPFEIKLPEKDIFIDDIKQEKKRVRRSK